MTRENKLALVVGFALILFVGILVSDHFSAARSQRSADLLPASDPVVDARAGDPELLSFGPPRGRLASVDARGTSPILTAPPLPVDTSTVVPAPAPRRRQPRTIRMPDLQQMTPGPATSRGDDHVHEVRPGESLTTIADHYFGDRSVVSDLAAYNGLDDPNMLRAGQRLRIPGAKSLGTGHRAPAEPSSPEQTPATGDTYTVKPGDVLSTLSQTLLGTSRRWRELYEHNKSVIDDPDHLQVGTLLKIPAR